jgi:hypothetical protein
MWDVYPGPGASDRRHPPFALNVTSKVLAFPDGEARVTPFPTARPE